MEMRTRKIADSKVGHLFIKILAAGMESRFRYRFFGPAKILQGADIRPGQTVLELGCGTGYFTLPIARLIGDHGHLIAMDVLPDSVEFVARRVQSAGLTNVRVIVGDALDTKLDSGSLDAILLFGVIPAPMLPLKLLIPEMHRILKPGGTLAVWPPVWLRKSILRSGLFTYANKRNAVFNFTRK
jgi:ubiquinone/menaquinone biosynthesis C-methylase UbiE